MEHSHIRVLDELQEGLFRRAYYRGGIRAASVQRPSLPMAYKKQQRGGGARSSLRPEAGYGSRRLLGTPTLTRVRHDKAWTTQRTFQTVGLTGLVADDWEAQEVIVDEGETQMPSVMRVRRPLRVLRWSPSRCSADRANGYGKFDPELAASVLASR